MYSEPFQTDCIKPGGRIHYYVYIKGGKADSFAVFVFLMSRGCCVALPHDATALSVVCDRGIS